MRCSLPNPDTEFLSSFPDHLPPLSGTPPISQLALKAAGGKTGFPMTISSLQMGVGCLYGLFMWAAPDGRDKPSINFDDVIKMLPVAFCAMGSHCASVFALSAGAVSFAQIVKSAEPGERCQ